MPSVQGQNQPTTHSSFNFTGKNGTGLNDQISLGQSNTYGNTVNAN